MLQYSAKLIIIFLPAKNFYIFFILFSAADFYPGNASLLQISVYKNGHI